MIAYRTDEEIYPYCYEYMRDCDSVEIWLLGLSVCHYTIVGKTLREVYHSDTLLILN